MKRTTVSVASLLLVAGLWACGGSDPSAGSGGPAVVDEHAGHDHAPGEGHGEMPSTEPAEEHAHDEVFLGTASVGAIGVELFQGHGAVEAGKEGHLVAKLPYNDKGATIVRAWIGTADRLSSYVGKGEYAPDHDDYDVHATAPEPLPRDVKWWIELEKPDGSKHLGSIDPLR